MIFMPITVHLFHTHLLLLLIYVQNRFVQYCANAADSKAEYQALDIKARVFSQVEQGGRAPLFRDEYGLYQAEGHCE